MPLEVQKACALRTHGCVLWLKRQELVQGRMACELGRSSDRHADGLTGSSALA